MVTLTFLGPQPTSSGGGATGPAGKSAYQLAVIAGFVGTVDEWLASLVGASGGGDPGLGGASLAGWATATANVAASPTPVLLLSVTFDGLAGRSYQVTGFASGIGGSAGGSNAVVRVQDGAAVLEAPPQQVPNGYVFTVAYSALISLGVDRTVVVDIYGLTDNSVSFRDRIVVVTDLGETGVGGGVPTSADIVAHPSVGNVDVLVASVSFDGLTGHTYQVSGYLSAVNPGAGCFFFARTNDGVTELRTASTTSLAGDTMTLPLCGLIGPLSADRLVAVNVTAVTNANLVDVTDGLVIVADVTGA